MDKNEYLTGEYLGLKASTVEQLDLSVLLGKLLINGWIKIIKKKGCLRD